MTFIQAIDTALGLEAQKNCLPMPAGDVVATWTDVEALRQDVGFEPRTPLESGIPNWVA